MQRLHGEFEKRDIEIIAVSNEETDVSGLEHLLAALEAKRATPNFTMVADVGRKATQAWERTTCYLIDEQGVVRQVFPMEIFHRPSPWVFLNEADRIFARDEQ